ncbi:MAG: pilus assembly protein TadG-related protein [Terriglobales bacterium]
MSRMTQFSRRRGERGQTIVLVAISIVSLLAMAALAIDVVTLYVARSEIQRAADAAALAGAKGIADSGITSLSSADLTGGNQPDIQNLARNMAVAAINAVIPNNPVGGSTPTLVLGSPTFNFNVATTSPVTSWQVTVALQQSNLPTFFARIFGRTGATVTASATAEAYNPANSSPFTPIAPRCVKPLLIANSNPRSGGTPFVDTTTGAINNQVTALTYDLTSDCCAPLASPPGSSFVSGTARIQYVPAQVTPNPANVCSSSCSGTPYEQSISCCDMNSYSYLSCGTSGNLQWDTTINPGGAAGPSATAAECLIHAISSGPGAGQDLLDRPISWPASPMQIRAQSGPQSGNLVSTSSSVVTMPIVDTRPGIFPLGGGAVPIVGFMQAFIDCVEDIGPIGTPCEQPVGTSRTGGDISVTVLNIVGCSSSPNAATPIVGNGTAPIPVRLITAP